MPSSVYPNSPREAWERLCTLERALAEASSRPAAIAELRELAELARGRAPGAPLRLVTVDVTVGSAHEHLEILLLPSIFEPEEWAYTFLEGLLELPLDEYTNRRLVEVGCGSGWVSIALAKFTELAEIRGLDLNPQAAVVARCNAWLNGDAALVARLDFGTSNLLDALEPGERWDFVVGCIPQVLRTDSHRGGHHGLDDGDDERALYDLSNYTAIQNVYEDLFGLGLLARLLDECPETLGPGGRLLLNIAGRPGRAIIERMFSRRGFATEVSVVRRVRQAADTDIGPLVTLERQTGAEFEFFVEQRSREPIRAETALRWLTARGQGGERAIWHEVAVWKARLRLPREVLALRAALGRLGLPRLVDRIDLGAASQEQLGFVVELADRLARDPRIPAAHRAGDLRLRELVGRYLDRSFGLRLSPAELFVAPERAQAVYSLALASCGAGGEVLISHNIHQVYAGALAKAGVRAIVTNNTLDEIARLLEVFDVELVLLSVEPSERTNLSSLRAILDQAARRGILVVLDESPFFTITRGIEPWTLFELLARERDRPNLVVLCGLIKNAVYPDFELTLLLPVAGSLHADLERAAALTYSRISTPVQWFYERLFAELLHFRITFSAPDAAPERGHDQGRRGVPRSQRIARAARWPALDAGPGPAPAPTDEAEVISSALIEGLIAACASPMPSAARRPGRRPGSGGFAGLPEAVAAFLLETRQLDYAAGDIVVGQGVSTLIADLGVALGRRLARAPRVHVVEAGDGLLGPALEAAGCEVEIGPPAVVLARAGAEAPDVVVLARPHADQAALARWAAREHAWLVTEVSVDLEFAASLARAVVVGALPIEPGAGGLRIGWLASHDRELVAALEDIALAAPTLAAASAAAHVYRSATSPRS
jgi:methylase of polypeptide subunit release factors/aspartate/methionine/tyrosine aminotransferase